MSGGYSIFNIEENGNILTRYHSGEQKGRVVTGDGIIAGTRDVVKETSGKVNKATEERLNGVFPGEYRGKNNTILILDGRRLQGVKKGLIIPNNLSLKGKKDQLVQVIELSKRENLLTFSLLIVQFMFHSDDWRPFLNSILYNKKIIDKRDIFLSKKGAWDTRIYQWSGIFIFTWFGTGSY